MIIKEIGWNLRFSKRQTILFLAGLSFVCAMISYFLQTRTIVSLIRGALTPFVFVLIFTLFEILAYYMQKKNGTEMKWIKGVGKMLAIIGVFAYVASSFLLSMGGFEIFISNQFDVALKAALGVGFVLTLWGFIYHTLERILFFDRRHVTGVNGWLAIVWGNLITFGGFGMFFTSWTLAIMPSIAYAVFSIVIYYLIHFFVEEEQYSEDELYQYPPK